MLTLDSTAKSLFLGVLLSVALGACEGRATRPPDSGRPNVSQVEPETSPPIDSTDGESPDIVPAPQPAIALSGEGVLLMNPGSASPTLLQFNLSEADAQAALSTLLGEPTAIAQNDECGAGPMRFITWSNGLSINILNGQFMGWTVRPDTDSSSLTTVDGIGIGKSLAELDAAYDTEVFDSSLGIEFIAADSLFGLLSTNEPDGVITHLWSGVACNFR